MLQSMESQRVEYDLVTQQQQWVTWRLAMILCENNNNNKKNRLASKQVNRRDLLMGGPYKDHGNDKPPPVKSISSVQSLSRVRRFATPWTAACQAFLSIINFWNLLKLMSIESVVPSNHLILCHPFLLPSIYPSIRVFSNESAL